MNTRSYLEHDWYGGGVPANVTIGKNVFIDTSYGFAGFLSQREPGLVLGDGCGIYDRAALVVGPQGYVSVGAYTCLNATYVICHQHVEIGAHCLLSWGVMISDGPQPSLADPPSVRANALRSAAAHPERYLGTVGTSRPVVIEDNVWVGFDSVVLAGVRIGRGSVVGCKSVVSQDVPPYTVVAGNPAREIRSLNADDTEAFCAAALEKYSRA